MTPIDLDDLATTWFTFRRAVSSEDLAAAHARINQSLTEDFGYGYVAEWHWDLDRLNVHYVDNPRQAMFIAADSTGQAVGTAGIRIGAPTSVPPWLADRYVDRQRVAQLIRVTTMPDARGQGVARRLVEAVRRFVVADGQYSFICLHTNVKVPTARPFWESLPTTLMHDARADEVDIRFETLHYELAIDRPIAFESTT